jgi:hypothetical protein
LTVAFEELLIVSHVVYGLRIAADVALPGLPLQHGSDLFDVRIRLKERATFLATSPECVEFLYTGSPDDDDGQPNLRVGVLPGGDYFGFFYSDGVRFAVERRGREVWAVWPENYSLEDACTYLVGPVIGFVLRLRGVTCLHASAVTVGEQAIALVGFPGAGKSTTVAAFAQCGFPRVNLWPDSVRALFGTEEALPRITPTWDKRYMALGDNGFGFATKPLPLRAIYLLGAREAEFANPVIEGVAGSAALAELAPHTYVNYLLDRGMRSREFDVLSRVVAGIPIRRVRPTPDPSAVFDLAKAIAADAKRAMAPSPRIAASRYD